MNLAKLIMCFLLLIFSSNLVFSQDLTFEEQEVGINIALIGIGLEESLVMVTDDEVIVDYIVPELNSQDDLMLQLQSIFIVVAKFSPDTTYTIIKARYSEETDPLLIAQVPTDFTKMFVKGYIDFESYWSLVEVNTPDLVEEVMLNEENGGVGFSGVVWFVFGFILVMIVMLIIGKKKKYGVVKK